MDGGSPDGHEPALCARFAGSRGITGRLVNVDGECPAAFLKLVETATAGAEPKRESGDESQGARESRERRHEQKQARAGALFESFGAEAARGALGVAVGLVGDGAGLVGKGHAAGARGGPTRS